jgi:xylose isomerase
VHETKLRFATRLNSFGSSPTLWPKGHGKPSPLELAERASKAKGLTDVDLNYPDHVGIDPRVTTDKIRDLGLAVNGLAMRYYSNAAFKIGAFTNPDPAVRREAIELTKRGVEAARQAGCNLMTLCLDGMVLTILSSRLCAALGR